MCLKSGPKILGKGRGVKRLFWLYLFAARRPCGKGVRGAESAAHPSLDLEGLFETLGQMA